MNTLVTLLIFVAVLALIWYLIGLLQLFICSRF